MKPAYAPVEVGMALDSSQNAADVRRTLVALLGAREDDGVDGVHAQLVRRQQTSG